MKYKIINYISVSILIIAMLIIVSASIYNIIKASFFKDDYYALAFVLLCGSIICSKQILFGSKIVQKIIQKDLINFSVVLAWILWICFLIFTFFGVYGSYDLVKNFSNITNIFKSNSPAKLFYIALIVIFVITSVINIIITVLDVFYLIQIKQHNKKVKENTVMSIGF